MLQATRTLVKSAPELWAEVADQDALATHLGQFGELAITDCEQEKLVRWDAEHASGTLELEPAGFGTRVRLRAASSTITAPPPAADQDLSPAAREPAPAPRPRLWTRLLRRSPAPVPEPAAVQVPEPTTAVAGIPALTDDQVLDVLRGTLDALGTAHHRPFSRA